jgi:hypothetical protein
MKNATYVDQSDTIRTLTEEEMAVVSGGMTNQDYNNFQTRLYAMANRFKNSTIQSYIPQGRNKYWGLNFFAVNMLW